MGSPTEVDNPQTCEECGDEFEAELKCRFCRECADEKAMESLSDVEPPEGGWARGSDMDRL